MQKKLTIILSILILTTGCRSLKLNKIVSNKASEKVSIIELENSFGIIFPAELDVYFLNNNKRFTPTEKQIGIIEIEIKKQYLESDRKFNYEQVYVRTTEVYGDQEIDKQKIYRDLMKWSVKEVKRISKFDRQYVGYIENGEEKILINFIDFKRDPHNLKKELASGLIGGFHGWFSKNVKTKIYNLNTKKLSLH
jgi:hypothetical protein